ncbi:hypothetical protein ACQKM2_10900 [Streptomyces sp. NPDC004126]|uniref:hypothetical protein n=1 Tax=Streptomyces sp. NPDC004126 TaxID=3390695 RepID=UPI003D090D55
MRTAFVRRAVLTASAVSLSLLATACGSDSGDSGKKDDAKASPRQSAPAAAAAKGKSAAELAPLLVAQADLPEHKVEADAAAKAATGANADADKPECKPLVQLQTLVPVGKPAGTATIAATEKPKKPSEGASLDDKLDALKGGLAVTRTSVGLASYDGKGAEEAFGALKAAGTACAAGYTVTQDAEKTKIEKVAPSAAVTAGDEALAYNTVMDLKDGDKATMQFVVVRKGNTLATFYAMNLTGAAAQPKAVVEAQVKKLG